MSSNRLNIEEATPLLRAERTPKESAEVAKIGERVKEIRTRLGISREGLSACGASITQLTIVELGKGTLRNAQEVLEKVQDFVAQNA